jgi:glycosyltransferase involved in cell wall biosynthesis
VIKKILIILYTFPPYPGVGGRRWAKFAKYLAEKGYEVHVICCGNVFKEQSLWVKDTQHQNIKVHSLPVKYPIVMLHGVKNISDKLLYRFWKFYFSFYSKGVIFERTLFWKKQLQRKASEVIKKEKIRNVIVSIPPYRLASYSIAIKQKYPDINLIVDYRDPWTDNKSYHGFKKISSERLQHEQKLEKEVLQTADHIISVSSKMADDLKERKIGYEKIVTIPNGFDPSDILPISDNHLKANEDKTKFVYGGTLYNDLEYIITPLISYLSKLKNTNTSLYNRLSFDFYGNLNKELQDKLEISGNKCIQLHKPVPLQSMQQILHECSFCLLITPPAYSVVFNTKFCEYLANRKPILLFTYPCDASDFITHNKLGFHINPNNIEKDMDTFFTNINSVQSEFNNTFNIDTFSLPSLTKEIEKMLK